MLKPVKDQEKKVAKTDSLTTAHIRRNTVSVKPETVKMKNSPDPQKKSLPGSNKLISCQASRKSNGMLISIKSESPFRDKDISLSTGADNYLYITFYKTDFASGFSNNSIIDNSFGEVQYFNFPESVQLFFTLKKKIISKSLIIENNRVLISIFDQ